MRLLRLPYLQFSLHCAIGVGGVAALALTPPAEGKILLLPVSGESHGEMVRWATQGGARIVGTGPFGSLVIQGRSADLARQALSHGTLLLAGPAIECGATRA